ncbi:unnamed protein product [Leptosia nina]|uniref:Uncharacterized protein n=1 Tax=Leptosia nina TaxID=320188 RepID=A0AAV1JU02_9NEOP
MKFFIVVSALLALAAAVPVELTLKQIDAALSKPNLDASVRAVLEDALNKIMNAIFNGEQMDSVTVDLPLDVLPGILPENPIDPVPAPQPVPADPAPLPVDPAPIPSPDPKPSPAEEKPVLGPLVQVIVNVNKEQQQVSEVPAPGPVDIAVNPEPQPPSNPIDTILN